MHNSGLAFNMILQKIRYTPAKKLRYFIDKDQFEGFIVQKFGKQEVCK